MVSVFSSCAIGHGFELRSGQIKDYAFLFFLYFLAKHTLLMSTSKDWLVRNQNNASKWSDMSIRRLLFQWASTIQFQQRVLSTTKQTSLSLWSKCNLVSGLVMIWLTNCSLRVKQQSLLSLYLSFPGLFLIHALIQNIFGMMLWSYELRIGVYLLFIVQLITRKQNKEVTMTWLSIMEYMCPNWSSVCSFCLGSNPNLSSPDI